MKKLIISLAVIAFSSSCFAEPNLVYCPEKITCSEDGNINSCKASDGAWTPSKIFADHEVKKGDYSKFWVARGSKSPSPRARCEYVNETAGKISYPIWLETDKFKPYYNPATAAWYHMVEKGYQYACLSDRLACPFQAN